jgi:D-alanyl-D-alanine carboxypeptidase (penicillin-binding protein 5/6)
MYLILNAALKNETFYNIFTASNYTANYTSGGEAKTVEWSTTNQYITGKVSVPSGFTILGGKTGTTGAAGYCLVLLSENQDHERIISIVFNADCRSNLYLLMNQILSNYCL